MTQARRVGAMLRTIGAGLIAVAAGIVVPGSLPVALADIRAQRRRQYCAVCGCADCHGVRNLCCNCLETAIAVLELLADDNHQSHPACAPALTLLEHQLPFARQYPRKR